MGTRGKEKKVIDMAGSAAAREMSVSSPSHEGCGVHVCLTWVGAFLPDWSAWLSGWRTLSARSRQACVESLSSVQHAYPTVQATIRSGFSVNA